MNRAAESQRIQTLRGIACLLLVSYHVIGDGPLRGLGVPSDSAYRAFCDIFIHLRMPLFTFLSGFVYAYRPVAPGTGMLFARKKLQRLLIPLLVVATLYFVVQQLAPGTNTKQAWSEMWRIYVFPYNHFWFLQAIILIFAVTLVLELLGWLQRFEAYLGVFALVLLVHLWARIELNVFSVRQACYLAPFFLAGLGANRFHAQLWGSGMKSVMAAVFVVTFALHIGAVLELHGMHFQQRTLLGTALSMSGIFTLMYWTPANTALAWLGGFSFSIYLYHVFFTAGARIVLNHLGLHDIHAHFLLGCVLGALGPVCIELAVRSNRTARCLLLGQS